jgi:hypothetical protein
MAYFQTKKLNLGKFWWVLQWKMYRGIFYVVIVIRYIACFTKQKSGNPDFRLMESRLLKSMG